MIYIEEDDIIMQLTRKQLIYLPVDYQKELDCLALQSRRENQNLLENLRCQIEKMKSAQLQLIDRANQIQKENLILEKERNASQAKFKIVENDYNQAKQQKHMVH